MDKIQLTDKSIQKRAKLLEQDLKNAKSFSTMAEKEWTDLEDYGDDLIEVLLSFLPLKNKILLQRVSKQWKRLIFNRQYQLVIDCYNNFQNSHTSVDKILKVDTKVSAIVSSTVFYHRIQIKNSVFEYVLKVCPNINYMRIDTNLCNQTVFNLIAKYCVYLRTIYIGNEYYFGKNYGIYYNLDENIRMRSTYEWYTTAMETYSSIEIDANFLKSFVQKFPKLKCICCDTIEPLVTDNICNYWQNLTEIHITSMNENELQCLSKLSDLLSNRLKVIGIYNGGYKPESVLKLISKFYKLEVFHFKIISSNIKSDEFYSNFAEIGDKCTKIGKLFVIFKDNWSDSDRIMRSIAHFNKLRQLKVIMDSIKSEGRVIEYLGKCEALTNLSLIFAERDNDYPEKRILKDFDQYLPNLLYVSLNPWCGVNDITFQSLAKLKKLRKFTLQSISSRFVIYEDITDIGVCDLINNCSTLTHINFQRRPNITNKSIYAFIAKAEKNARIGYYLHMCSSVSYFGLDYIDRYIWCSLPTNLIIDWN